MFVINWDQCDCHELWEPRKTGQVGNGETPPCFHEVKKYHAKLLRCEKKMVYTERNPWIVGSIIYIKIWKGASRSIKLQSNGTAATWDTGINWAEIAAGRRGKPTRQPPSSHRDLSKQVTKGRNNVETSHERPKQCRNKSRKAETIKSKKLGRWRNI